MKTIALDNEKLRFHGRWGGDSRKMTGYWCRPYLEFKIQGKSFGFSTEGDSAVYSVKLDGSMLTNCSRSTGSLTFYMQDDKPHTIRITGQSTERPLIIKDLVIDGSLCKMEKRSRHILFIGDSLTAANGYSAVIPEEMDWDYTCVALGGLPLCDGRGYYSLPEKEKDAVRTGMETAFYKLCPPSVAIKDAPDYDLSLAETPDDIFINLGTNDALINEENAKGYLEVYKEFVPKIRQLYPNARIFLPLPSADSDTKMRLSTIESAAKNMEATLDNVKYIDTRSWNIEISGDNVHPTAAGYAEYARRLIKAVGYR